MRRQLETVVRRARAVLGAALAVATLAAAPAAAELAVDPAASSLVVRVFKAGFAKGLAHDHVVRAGDASGTVRFDPASPQEAAIEVVVPAASLVADAPEVRRAHGLEPLGDDDRREIQATMLGPGQLDAARHPRIAFASTAIAALGGDRYRVEGRLTLHGRTQPVTLTATAGLDGGTFRATGTLRFAQSAFGIEPYSAAMGAVKNRDEVELVLTIVAR
jgi:polyisoprenoid-binding protein YceI